MQKITPFLWFDKEAEEAASFYVSIFKNSKVVSVGRYGDAGPGPKGTAMSVTFELEGQSFFALNGGPLYKFTPAISLFVSCETQGEVDALWEKLCEGGKPNRCGWLTDKYGLSWQIGARQAVAEPGPREVEPGDEGHARHGQARHPGPAGCLRREVGRDG
jgi:predicted 3-demethylubiquinone-9 3-methyltransferase (glyoxalase superfamily)